jgi:oligoribonuclease
MPQSANALIWIDLEMTGLDPLRDTIIEIATAITDEHLNLIAEGPICAIHQPDIILAMMDEWNTKQHGQSGLVQRVRESQVSLAMAEQWTLTFLQQYVPENTSPMCGNSICHDRRFLSRYMPDLEKYFHYRHLDVSTLKELANRWMPTMPKFEKDSKHLAMSDIYDSIEELKYYRQHFFRPESD